MKYDPDTQIYLISYSRLPTNISAAVYEGYVGLGLVINFCTNTVEDVSCTLLTDVAIDFIKDIIIGYNLNDDIEPLINRIKLRFHGLSQKSICVIMHENYRKYHEWLKENRKSIDLEKKKDINNSGRKEILFSRSQKYPDHSIYLISYAKTPKNISLAYFRGYLGVGIVIDYKNNSILDCCGTYITNEAEAFVRSIVLNKSFSSHENIDNIIKKVKFSFHGASQKAVCVILRNIFKIYSDWRFENKEFSAQIIL